MAISQSPPFLPSILLLSLIFLLSGGTPCKSELNAVSSPTHSNFLKLNTDDSRGRMPFMWCAYHPQTCSWYGKNYICCFNRYCKDISRDPFNCGACGRACPFGLHCCDGACVDLFNDDRHCGFCFRSCPPHERCAFGMCGYGFGRGYEHI